MLWFIYLNFLHCALHTEAVTGQNIRIPEDHEYPFVVSIGHKNLLNLPERNHRCTGVLISNQNVLTAAHCLSNQTLTSIQVTLGFVDLRKGIRYDVERCTTYNEWAEMKNQIPEYMFNDIGVLTLSRPTDISGIRPVRLSPLNKLQIEGTQGAILGYGITNDGFTSRFLIAGIVNILSAKDCQKRMRMYSDRIIKLDVMNFCSAAHPYILTECGDSGGPIFNKNNELVGIHLGTCPLEKLLWYKIGGSSVEMFLKKYLTNLHASIDFYREFINDFL